MATEKIPPALKAKLALAHLSPMQHGHAPASYKQLLRDFQLQVSEKTIKKAIIDAFVEKYVTITSVPSAQYVRESATEDALYEAFGVRSVIVIRCDPLLSSDAIHAQLGHALADVIDRTPLMFRSGDIIAVGSGRGVHHTVVELTKREKKKLADVSLMSLSGSVFAHASELPLEFLLDADYNTAMLAQYFEATVDSRLISYPIAHSGRARERLLRETPLDPIKFVEHIPAHAIVGVGVLGGRHRFYKEIKGDRRSSVLRPIWQTLKELGAWVDNPSYQALGYCPVGDICNRLFFIPPPLNMLQGEREKLEAEVPAIIEEINCCLLTVTKTQLNKCKSLTMIAGSRLKAPAIFHMLRHRLLKIDTLAIDLATAREVLELQSDQETNPHRSGRI